MWMAACSSDPQDTAARLRDAGADAEVANPDGGSDGTAPLGSACKTSSDCDRGLSCDPEVDQSFVVDKLPRGVDEISSSAFPGGSCTPVPASQYDASGATSCNPLLPPDGQGCGPKGACVVVNGFTETIVACRPRCTPDNKGSGCERFGYTCSFEINACVEGCQSDEECKLLLVDDNGDGEPDSVAYDEMSRAVCDTETFRCTHPGKSSVATGSACARNDDCEPDGRCLESLQAFVGLRFSDGFCTKLGCDQKGRECNGDGSVCTRVRSFVPGAFAPLACMLSCRVGAEPETDRLGMDGHGAGCRKGYRCHYNGETDDEAGVCVGGNYNAVTSSNIGAACLRDDECYSPFGLGLCLQVSVGGVQPDTGTCTVTDCAVPGLPDDLCGKAGQCVGLSGDRTFCTQTCAIASECAASYACTDDDGDPTTSKICLSACSEDADCRKGQEICEFADGATAGQCVASRR
jgi:hypothetical protein